jgi:hypothetical protein
MAARVLPWDAPSSVRLSAAASRARARADYPPLRDKEGVTRPSTRASTGGSILAELANRASSSRRARTRLRCAREPEPDPSPIPPPNHSHPGDPWPGSAAPRRRAPGKECPSHRITLTGVPNGSEFKRIGPMQPPALDLRKSQGSTPCLKHRSVVGHDAGPRHAGGRRPQ